MKEAYSLNQHRPSKGLAWIRRNPVIVSQTIMIAGLILVALEGVL